MQGLSEASSRCQRGVRPLWEPKCCKLGTHHILNMRSIRTSTCKAGRRGHECRLGGWMCEGVDLGERKVGSCHPTPLPPH